MKIRSGFVGNSSSSSFIIFTKNPEDKNPCKHCGRVSYDIRTAAGTLMSDFEDECRCISSKDAVDEMVECMLDSYMIDSISDEDRNKIANSIGNRDSYLLRLSRPSEDVDVVRDRLMELGVKRVAVISLEEMPHDVTELLEVLYEG